MRVSQVGSRAIGFALVFAVAGFTFAISTSVSDFDESGVASRAVGTNNNPLRFTSPRLLGTNGQPSLGTLLNPATKQLVATPEYDLGDALFGSAIARYITADGGVKPYRFTSADYTLNDPKSGKPVTVLSLANAILNTTSTLTLGVSGAVNGNTPATINSASQTFDLQPGLRFHVTLTDAYSSNTSAVKGTNSATQEGNFNIRLFDKASTPFRFAVDTIPPAQLAVPYVAKIDVLAGRGPLTFSTVSVKDSTGNATTLSALGLFLSTDGTLYGRPLATGTYSITARATDITGAVARSRRIATVSDQAFNLAIADNRVTSSDTMTLSCAISGDSFGAGGDALRLSGLINVLGQDNFSLMNSDFSFQIGSIGFSGRLDQHGKYSQDNGKGSKYTVKINANTGKIDIRMTRGTFIKGFDLTGIKNGDLVTRPLKIVVGSAVSSTEVIQFASSVSGTSYGFNFDLGRTGANSTGGFQIVSVRGRDDVSATGAPGDAWRVSFVAQPRQDNVVINPAGLHEGLDNVQAVNVRIGGGFTQVLTGSQIIGQQPIKYVGGPAEGIQSFNFNVTKGKGTLATRSLPSSATGIPTASAALKFNTIFFPLGLDFVRLPASGAIPGEATFTGEHARRIFSRGTKYTDVPSPRQQPGIFK